MLMTKKTSFLSVSILSVGLLFGGVLSRDAAAETKSDELVIAKSIANIATLDPGTNFEFIGTEILNNIYERLMMFEPEDLESLVPGVAKSYELSGGGKTVLFKLRPNQVFHSGNPLTADDVAFSLRRVVKLDDGPAFILNQFGWDKANVDQYVKAVDDMTVSLEINSDLGAGLLLNTLTTFGIVDKQVALSHEKDGDLGSDWLQSNTAGSGPYSLRLWRANELIILDANPNYRKGEPAMKRVITKHSPETATQRLGLEKGDFDIAVDLTSDQLDAIKDNDDIKLVDLPSARILYISVNTAYEPLGNKKVQEALRHLVDYDGMANSFLRGKVAVHQSVWPAGNWSSVTDKPFDFDIEKAKALLKEAGHEDGFSAEFHTLSDSPYPEIAQALQQTFAKANITLEIIPAEGRVHWPKLSASKHQLAQGRWGPDYNDPHSNLDAFVRAPLSGEMQWSDEGLKKLVFEAAVETDLDKREMMYIDLQKRLQAEAPLVMMYQLVNVLAMRENVSGFVRGPTANMVYYRLVTKD